MKRCSDLPLVLNPTLIVLLTITSLLLTVPSLNAQEIIDPRSGQLVLSVTDLTLQAGPVTLEVRRSLDTGKRPPGLLGLRWRLNWESRLLRAGPLVLIQEATGSLSFSQQGQAGEYRSALGDRLILEKTGHAIRTKPDGTKEIFDAQGRLAERDYRNGNRAVLRYGSDGRVTRIDGPHGSFLRFTMDKAGRVTLVEASSTATVRSHPRPVHPAATSNPKPTNATVGEGEMENRIQLVSRVKSAKATPRVDDKEVL